MVLNTLERLLLLSVLPKEGDYTTLKIVRELRESLSFTEAEHAVLNFVTREDGNLAWNVGEADEVEVNIGGKARGIVAELLRKLDAEKKMTVQHITLFEKFLD